MSDLDLDALEEVAVTARYDGQHWYAEEEFVGRWPECCDCGCPVMLGANRKAEALHVATFDPPTVLALIERARVAEAKVARAEALVEHAENTPTARFIHPSRLHAAITTPADTAEQRVRFTRYEASEKHGCIAETRTGASHCQTCTCGCTCGFGGLHDDANPRCELNPTTEPTEGRDCNGDALGTSCGCPTGGDCPAAPTEGDPT